jgi:hypothetical protein
MDMMDDIVYHSKAQDQLASSINPIQSTLQQGGQSDKSLPASSPHMSFPATASASNASVEKIISSSSIVVPTLTSPKRKRKSTPHRSIMKPTSMEDRYENYIIPLNFTDHQSSSKDSQVSTPQNPYLAAMFKYHADKAKSKYQAMLADHHRLMKILDTAIGAYSDSDEDEKPKRKCGRRPAAGGRRRAPAAKQAETTPSEPIKSRKRRNTDDVKAAVDTQVQDLEPKSKRSRRSQGRFTDRVSID